MRDSSLSKAALILSPSSSRAKDMLLSSSGPASSGMRPKSARHDSRCVRFQCERSKQPFTLTRTDVPGHTVHHCWILTQACPGLDFWYVEGKPLRLLNLLLVNELLQAVVVDVIIVPLRIGVEPQRMRELHWTLCVAASPVNSFEAWCGRNIRGKTYSPQVLCRLAGFKQTVLTRSSTTAV